MPVRPPNLPPNGLKNSKPHWSAWECVRVSDRSERLTEENLDMKKRGLIFWLLVIADLAALSVMAKAQALTDSETPPAAQSI